MAWEWWILLFGFLVWLFVIEPLRSNPSKRDRADASRDDRG